MPGFSEIRLYLQGLWLLARGNAQGFRLLDISDRGMMRSFWAIVWCLPPTLVSWFWLRSVYLAAMPEGTRLGGIFFLRLAMLELLNWIIPLILVGIMCWTLDIGRRFPAIVISWNWLSVPFSYAFGLLNFLIILLPPLRDGLVILWLILMLALVVSVSRILKLICGPQQLMTATLTMVLIIPALLLSDLLENFLGIYPA